jgi:hypothetical protein
MLIQSGISFTVATATQTADAGVAPATGTGMADDAVAPEIQGAPIEEAQTPGVLRHLQAGKFKGVADVRLRIVFQKQLAELAEQQAKARATEGSETLVANLAVEIKGFSLATDPAEAEAAVTEAAAVDTEVMAPMDVDTAIADFQAAVNTATTGLVESEGLDLQSYAATLQAAFDSLVSQLEIALSPDAEVPETTLPVADQENAVETTDVTQLADDLTEIDANVISVTDFLASLREMFAQELTGLLESAESRDPLPPLSEPQGNGRAFDKFKAIYDELSATDAVLDDNANIDVEA